MFPTEIIKIEGVPLAVPVGTKKAMVDQVSWNNHVNGCGAGNAKFDFVPDTMWGLRVTPV